MVERKMDGGEIFLEVLNRHGVEYIIGSPGSEWPPLWEALSRRRAEGEPAPTYINCRHEGLAVGIATGYHRATRKLPAVILHTTSGGLNCATNLRGALHNGTPMLVVAGESISYGDGGAPDPGAQWLAGLSEIGGPTRLLAPVMKWAITVRTAYNLADTFHRACQIAMSPPMGPVFVNAPLELMLEQIAIERLPHPPELAASPQADMAALERVACLLMEASHPVIFTEAAGKEPEAVDALVQLAELLALPVVEAAAPACTNFPTDHPAHQGYSPKPFLSEADVILLVESATPWHPPSKGPGPGCKVISIGQDPDLALRPYSGYPCDVQIHGPAATNLKALMQIVRELKGRQSSRSVPDEERAARLHDNHLRLREAARQEALAAKDATPIDPRWLCHVFNEVVPADAVVVNELIVHRQVLDRYLERSRARSYMRSFGGLGQGLPNALGMKLAMPDQLVVAVVGDGSFHYNPVVACFGLCQERRMPILTVIFNNHGYASMQGGLAHHYPDGYGARGGGRELATAIAPRPDYPKLVEAFGGWGQAVDHPAEIVPALQRGIKAVQEGIPALVDVSLAW
jgi:thiamine pyrophosphate-dependent acetolactate synthase large subunit-like protein